MKKSFPICKTELHNAAEGDGNARCNVIAGPYV